MKTVLVPLDGSELAEEALSKGLEQVSGGVSEVLLVHCLDFNLMCASAPLMPPHTFVEIEEQDRERNQRYLDRHLAALKERGYQARSLIVRGEPVETIVEAARQQGVDLILLSTHGRTGLARFFMGSVAEGIIRRADRPVLVIPSRIKVSHEAAETREAAVSPS